MGQQNPKSSARDELLRYLAVAERRRDIGGIATSVLEGGQGPPLLLIHGGTQAGALLWWRVLPALCSRYRVLAPDLPGLGTSEPMAPSTSTGSRAGCSGSSTPPATSRRP